LPAAVERLIRKLGARHRKLRICYEAGPTGSGLSPSTCASGFLSACQIARFGEGARSRATKVAPFDWRAVCNIAR